MWKVITLEFILPVSLILLFIFEIVIPIITDKPLFVDFRRKKKKIDESTGDLSTKIKSTKEKFAGVKEEAGKIKEEVEGEVKKVTDLKKEADDLPS